MRSLIFEPCRDALKLLAARFIIDGPLRCTLSWVDVEQMAPVVTAAPARDEFRVADGAEAFEWYAHELPMMGHLECALFRYSHDGAQLLANDTVDDSRRRRRADSQRGEQTEQCCGDNSIGHDILGARLAGGEAVEL